MSEKTDRQKAKGIAREYFQKNIDNVSTGTEGFPDASSFIYGFVDGYILAQKEIEEQLNEANEVIKHYASSKFPDKEVGWFSIAGGKPARDYLEKWK